MNKTNYYLVLEKRFGDYNLIDINKLDICNGLVLNTLASIDTFTANFTEEEIKSSIARSNIISSDYLDGNLKIISDNRHHLNVINKEMFTIIHDFCNGSVEIHRELRNKIFGNYKKIVEIIFNDPSFIQTMLDRFKEALKINDKQNVLHIIEELPYERSRNIYLVIYEEIIKRRQENLLNLKKLDDVA